MWVFNQPTIVTQKQYGTYLLLCSQHGWLPRHATQPRLSCSFFGRCCVDGLGSSADGWFQLIPCHCAVGWFCCWEYGRGTGLLKLFPTSDSEVLGSLPNILCALGGAGFIGRVVENSCMLDCLLAIGVHQWRFNRFKFNRTNKNCFETNTYAKKEPFAKIALFAEIVLSEEIVLSAEIVLFASLRISLFPQIALFFNVGIVQFCE